MIKKYLINIIGCGRLGQALAFLLQEYAHINCVLNQSLNSSLAAVKFIGTGIGISKYSQLTNADIYLIATGDDKIETACQKLAATNILKPGNVVFHCSGSLSSDVLSSAHTAGAKIASIHPNISFADPALSITEFAGTLCAAEGETDAVAILTKLFSTIGATVFTINKTAKTTYHLAGCIASNYLVTLSYIANKCYQQAGVPEKIAKQIVNSLMGSTLNNLTKLSHKAALTGPIARGDIKTIANHISVLEKEIKEIYALLGKQTLALVGHDKQEQLLHLLAQ
jgi:predicted short-subunit dehydrogenase-like oxidoreductase (DUF2520 family)